jgi:hypothetical protein
MNKEKMIKEAVVDHRLVAYGADLGNLAKKW